jgi:hypothetical protein
LLARSSNCGGNSAALTACRSVYTSFRIIAADHDEPGLAISAMNASDKETFKHVTGLHWIPQAKIMVTTGMVNLDDPKRIIVACDTPFDNVPQKRFGKAPLTHAVAHADGSTALISVEEFKKLDLTGFVDVRTMITTNISR